MPVIPRLSVPSLSSKHRATLSAVFATPTPAGIEWRRIEALFAAVGCTVVEGRGSRVRILHGTADATFHRPHPGKEAKPYQVRDTREYLVLLGITPDSLPR